MRGTQNGRAGTTIEIMKLFLLLISLLALAATGCQSPGENQAGHQAADRVDWTRGGGAIGLP